MSEVKDQLDLLPAQLEIVRNHLRQHVPDRRVLAFGSRTRGRARKYSDLDLAIMGDDPLDYGDVMDLDEDLSWSNLPFNVDLVVWSSIVDDYMRVAIRRDGIPVQEAAEGQRVTAGQEPASPSP